MIKRFENILNLNATIAKQLFLDSDYPWEVLSKINKFIIDIGSQLDNNYKLINNNIWVHNSAKISDKSTIIGPCIIGENTAIRPNAYIRGNAIIGKNCVIGNCTEVKNSIIFDNVQCPHYNYIGDSILGEYTHIGAGVILSNIKSDKTNIVIKDNDLIYKTNLRKMGSILGDHTEIGCNSVICPGSIIFPNTNVYPLTMIRGIIESNKIVKNMNNIVEKNNRN